MPTAPSHANADTMQAAPRLLLVVPCYNEEEVLQDSFHKLDALVARMEQQGLIACGRILMVDDGSKDTTWQIISSLSLGGSRGCGIKLAHNVGHQRALRAGLDRAAQMPVDAVVSIDADLQDDIEAIPEMVEKYRSGCEIVYGVRRERKTDTAFKRLTAEGFYRLLQSMGGEVVYNHADFRLMSRRAVQQLAAYPERNLFLRGMVPLLGLQTDKVFYDRLERTAGTSKYPLKRMLSLAFDGITSFSIRPLRLITVAGLLFTASSIVAILYALTAYIQGKAIAGWTSLLISLWFLGGSILTAIGIIGEYIGKIYTEVKRRPLYFVEEETK